MKKYPSNSSNTPENINKNIYHYALRLLTKRDYSSAWLAQKIALKFPDTLQNDIELIFVLLRNMNYLNNERFIENRIQHYQNERKGPRYIIQQLMQKGVSKEEIQPFINIKNPIWIENGLYLLKKNDDKIQQHKNPQQFIYHFLSQKGYITEHIQKIIFHYCSD